MESEKLQEEKELDNKGVSEKSTNKKNFIIGLLILFLLSSLVYNYYSNNNSQKELAKISDGLKEVERSKNILETEFNSLMQDHNRMKVDLENKDTLLTVKDKEIEQKEIEIKRLLGKNTMTEKELKEARRLIQSLSVDVKSYEVRIKELEGANLVLREKQDSLEVQVGGYISELSTEREAARLEKETVGSTFSLSKFNIQGIRVSNSGKEKETARARRVDKIRVNFDIDKNQKAPSGDKELFIAVYLPDGSLGKFDGANSGTMELRSGERLFYSDRVNVPYEQGAVKTVTFDWEGYEYPKGEYRIAVYHNGFRIGQEVIKLR